MTAENGKVLEVGDLSARYGETPILRGVSFEISRGEILGLVGRNGAGKSTLCKAVMGLVAHDAATLRLGGTDIAALRSHRRSRAGIAMGHQEGGVFPELDVVDNLKAAGIRGERIDRALALFPVLERKREQPAGSLSGGEQKMLVLARSLSLSCDLLILDEPTEGLQPSNIALLKEHLEAARQEGRAVLLVEQRLNFVRGVTDRIVVLEKGEIVLQGDSDDQSHLSAVHRRLVL